MSPELGLEKPLAVGDAGRLACLVEAGPPEGVLGAFDDEGAGARVEGIGVDLEQAMLVAPEDEGEGIERQVGPEPGVLRVVDVQGRLEGLGKEARAESLAAVGATTQAESAKAGRAWDSGVK